MKTLDEVIEDLRNKSGLVICSRPKDDHWVVPIEVFRGALHYLENYRDSKAWLELEKNKYAEAVDNCEIAEAKYTKMVLESNRNDPLSWDELKGMEGKPVWVEANSGILRYGIIDGFFDLEGDEMIRWMTRYGYIERTKNMQGVEWQAYRKERK